MVGTNRPQQQRHFAYSFQGRLAIRQGASYQIHKKRREGLLFFHGRGRVVR